MADHPEDPAQALQLNDAQGAANLYRRGLLAGTWTLDWSRRIFAMQDDPSELARLIQEANQDPAVAAALKRLTAPMDRAIAEADREHASGR